MKKLLWAMLAASVVTAPASARMEKFVPNPDCPQFGTMYIRDDVTGLQYIHVTDCEGHSCLYPFTGPMPPPRILARPINPPVNLYPDLVAYAATVIAPNTDVGIYYTDANGDITRFRTFATSQESEYYWEMWRNESGGATLGQVEPNGRTPERLRLEPVTFTTARDGALAWRAQNQALDELGRPSPNVRALLATYFGAGERLAASPDWRGIGRVVAYVREHESGIQVTSAPGASTISFEPIAPAFAGEASVVSADGRTIWQGECRGSTTVDLSAQPSGTYFVRGPGKSIVVNVAR